MASSISSRPSADGRGVLAVLGPTNTGKTHLAIERMIAHESGLIGLPLRLLAREVYERVADKVGPANVALVTGEEKINADNGARFTVSTVEAMPDETNAAFVAIDEVQLAADPERGHVFTDRIMNLRGRQETMLLGAATVQRALQALLAGIDVITRPRMSMLTWAGQKKITRLPQRSAIVAFSADEVYAIAELIRRQRGGAAVVLGSLSPRTRNAQVALYQSGDVDFLVATDAIGMGLNLDLDHVAFAQERKFDGFSQRRLTPAEMGQIAGRAGRHIRNGTFGVTGQVAPFDDALIERLETHDFDPVQVLIWRNRDLSYASIADLRASLEAASDNRLLMKSFPAPDLVALANLARDEEVADLCKSEADIRLLWDVCQVPDYRKISPGEHAGLLGNIFLDIARTGRIKEDWFARQVAMTDRTDGDIDALSARIAHVRTWTYLSHRAGWLEDAAHWQEATRQIEDRLSDALHESLTKRFIDRRTSVLMRRLRENAMLEAEISDSGEVVVEGHHVGRLMGFRFTPDGTAAGAEAKAATGAAMKALATEIARRAERLCAAANGDIVLGADGTLRWLGEPVAKTVAGDEVLRPRIVLLADEQLTGAARESVAGRLERWLANHVSTLLKPLTELAADETLTGIARGVAFRLIENLGIVERREVASDIQSLDQTTRAGLRRHGVRFGAYHIFVPALLKPAPTALIALLWALKHGNLEMPGLSEVPAMLAAGRTSFAADPKIDRQVYQVCGFRLLGQKAVRIDILERLADLIRPALAWRPGSGTPAPDGAVDGRCFIATPAMLSILGATHEDIGDILKGLGYRGEAKPEAEVMAMLPAKAAPVPGEDVAAAVDARTEPAFDEKSSSEAPSDQSVSADEASAEAAAAENAPSEDAPVEDDGSEAAETTAVEAELVGAEAGRDRLGVPDNASVEAGLAEADAVAQAGDGPEKAEDEAKTITLWRPARFGRRDTARRASARPAGKDGAFDGHRAAGKGTHKGKPQGGGDDQHGGPRNARHGGKGANRGNAKGGGKGAVKGSDWDRRQARPSRAVDPDSPFAKLAQLKAELEKRDG